MINIELYLLASVQICREKQKRFSPSHWSAYSNF
jgi:hypothetical protein